MRVRVKDGWQIAHDGKVYTSGDLFDAPQTDVEGWIASGYAEKPTERKSESSLEDAPDMAAPGATPDAKPIAEVKKSLKKTRSAKRK